MVGGAGLRWWCLAVLSCSDVGGSARSMWLALGGCRYVCQIVLDGKYLLSSYQIHEEESVVASTEALVEDTPEGNRECGGHHCGRHEEEEKWVPVTKLGRLVHSDKIRSLE
ncbi:hypothetical protein SO802_026783 [Lithocarpus litseifolius]|uniref:Secreted protein n=1 Tax=Lithocarpus litseifolius TaxID=425828 RepID=A0AAW2C268_9ROSI